jgi:lysophospholipase L1-like esterase
LNSDAPPATWLFTGDSITHGALHTFGWRTYTELFAERLRFELRRPQDMVINTGISGDRCAGLIDRWEWRVARFQPSVVSVMMGMNDCTAGAGGRESYRANLNSIVDRIQAIPKCVPLLHTMNAITRLEPGRSDLPAYVDIVRDVAMRRQVPLVDHYAEWEKANYYQWLGDGTIHPNEYGHRVFANRIFRELEIFDPNSYTCKLIVPG